MCTDGKPCHGATDDFDLEAMGEQEINDIQAVLVKAVALNKVEKSYRTLLLNSLVRSADRNALNGLKLVADNQLANATELFHELQDTRKAMEWLIALPKELCPVVIPSSDTPEGQAMMRHGIISEIVNLFEKTSG